MAIGVEEEADCRVEGAEGKGVSLLLGFSKEDAEILFQVMALDKAEFEETLIEFFLLSEFLSF